MKRQQLWIINGKGEQSSETLSNESSKRKKEISLTRARKMIKLKKTESRIKQRQVHAHPLLPRVLEGLPFPLLYK